MRAGPMSLLTDYPKHVTLRDGTRVILRPMTKNDQAPLLAFFRTVPEGDRLFLKEDVTDPATIRAWAEGLDYARVLPILAEAGGRIVADATLHFNVHGWSRHVAEIRTVVAPAFQRKGLGSLLAHELVGHATTRGIRKIVAEVMDAQPGAMRAFTNLGFVEEARLRGHVTDASGALRDLILLSNDVDALWARMEDQIADFRPEH